MSRILKRKAEDTGIELCNALEKLAALLEEQNDEEEATRLLRASALSLKTSPANSQAWQDALQSVHDCFEGEQELSAYTMQSKNQKDWSKADELYLASTTVWNLVRRLRRTPS